MLDGAHRHVDMVLACLIVFQFCLFLMSLKTNGLFGVGVMWEVALHVAFLLALAGVFLAHRIHQKKLRQRAESNQEQLDAMFNMIGTVKHKLNNDMQVVLGNAELAEILIDAGGNASKAVNNVSDAAYNANERIEQLAVINAMRNSVPTLIDLNATLRECMARLASEMPSAVSLELELETLSSRVMADKALLRLSLTHLIRQASMNITHGGKVFVRTRNFEYNTPQPARSSRPEFVIAEIHIIGDSSSGMSNHAAGEAPVSDTLPDDALSHDKGAHNASSHGADALQTDFDTSKAIVERSGVQSVRLSRAGNESLFSMRFYTSAETRPANAKEKLMACTLFR